MPCVFAYGSNLTLARIEERVGAVAIVSVGKLERHALRFHKIGRDGSGKADAYATGRDDDAVWGVVYELSTAAKRRLDRVEGLGAEYLEAEVAISAAAADVDDHFLESAAVGGGEVGDIELPPVRLAILAIHFGIDPVLIPGRPAGT